MTTLEELYYNHINPCERNIKSDSEETRLVKQLDLLENKLLSMLNESQIELFDKYQNCQNSLANYSRCEGFTEGFVLGAKIMLEVMSEKTW